MNTKIFLAAFAAFAFLLAGCPGEAGEAPAFPHPEISAPGAEIPAEEAPLVEAPAEAEAPAEGEAPAEDEASTEEVPLEETPGEPVEEADEGSEPTAEELASLFDIEISEAPEDFEYGKAPGEE